MGLQLILGGSGTGKSSFLYKNVIKRSLEYPTEHFLAIVPEQFTMATQKRIVEMSERHGTLNIDILSFERLAKRMFEEAGLETLQVLDDTGKCLLLRKVMEENRELLAVFGRKVGMPGFTEEMKSMISEFSQYGIGEQELAAMQEQFHNQPLLLAKFKDLALIMHEFQEQLKNRFVINEELLSRVCELLPNSDFIKKSHIVLDEYTGFTPVQYNVLEGMLKYAKSVTVTLMIRDVKQEDYRKECEEDPFLLTIHTSNRLKKIAEQAGVTVHPDIILNQRKRFTKDGELAGLEESLFRFGVKHKQTANMDTKHTLSGKTANMDMEHTPDGKTVQTDVKCTLDGKAVQMDTKHTLSSKTANMDMEHTLDGKTLQTDVKCTLDENNSESVPEEGKTVLEKEGNYRGCEVEIASCGGTVSEAEYIAERICTLVREKNLRYREIAVLTPDIKTDYRMIVTAFQKYNIPCFVDYKRSICSNPMVEALRGALDIVGNHFSYESVMRYLRTGLSSLERSQVDQLENHLLAKGIRGYRRWTGNFRTEDEALLAARDRVLADVGDLYEKLKPSTKKAGMPVRDMVEALYEFGVKLSMEQKILKLQKQFADAGELSKAKEYQQTYGKIMELYDKIVLLLGTERFHLEDFIGIFDAGVQELKVGVIPPTLDIVTFGDIERTRLMNVKVLFLMGVNEGMIPKSVSKKGILTQSEREFLFEKGMELSPTERASAWIQKFYLYRTLTQPSEQLYVSYKRTNGEGKSARPSYLIGHLCKIFPQFQVIDWEQERLTSPMLQMMNETTAYTYLAEHMEEYLSKGKLPMLVPLYQELKNRGLAPELLRQAARKTEEKGRLSKQIAEMLYGTCLSNNVSRLENYAKCAYQHFITYGLQLAERKEFEVMYADVGNIYHEALELFSKKIQEEGQSWKNLDVAVRERVVEETLNQLETEYEGQAILDTARSRYMFQCIRDITRKTIDVLQQQVQQGDFIPQGFEVRFASDKGLKELCFAYDDGTSMDLRGVLDRVDYYHQGDNIYIKVVDYKSGAKKFQISDVYHHLQLQLIVYMEAAIGMAQRKYRGKTIVPGGVLYYNIDDPVSEEEKLSSNAATAYEKNVNDAYLKALQPNGLLNGAQEVIEAMDHNFKTEKGNYKSLYIPVNRTAKGELSGKNNLVTAEDFTRVMEFVHHEVHQLGKEILDGNIAVSPCAELKSNGLPNEDTAPCRYCQYQSICGFDPRIPGYAYRLLEPKTLNDILKKHNDSKPQQNARDTE